MKVAWLCPYPVSSLEGVPLGRSIVAEHPSTWIPTLAAALVSHVPGLDLHLVTGSPWLTREHTVAQAGFTVHALRAGAVPATCRGWPAWFPGDVATGYASTVRVLHGKLREIRPEIVHGHGTESAYGLATVTSGIPGVVSVQGILNRIFADRGGVWWRRRKELERRCIRRGKFFIAKTPFAREFIAEINPAATVFMSGNPVHPAFFNVRAQPAAARQFVFVGSLTPEKGLVELIEALARVSGAELVVIGTGPESFAAGLRHRAESLGLGSRIRWEGHKDSAAIARILAESRALVLPSYMETSPNVVAEAMCAGLPVIATTVGGVPSMVAHGETGLLVSPRHVAELATAVQAMVDDPGVAARMGEEGLRRGRKAHDPVAAAARILDVYKCVR